MIKSILRSILKPVVQGLTGLGESAKKWLYRLAAGANTYGNFPLWNVYFIDGNFVLKVKFKGMTPQGTVQPVLFSALNLAVYAGADNKLYVDIGNNSSYVISVTGPVVTDGLEHVTEISRTGTTVVVKINNIVYYNGTAVITPALYQVGADSVPRYGRDYFIYDLELNGIKWGIDQKDYKVQMSNPEALNSEIVPNPTFASSASGYTVQGGVTIAPEPVGVRMTVTNASTGLIVNVGPVPGRTYLVEVEATPISGGALTVSVGTLSATGPQLPYRGVVRALNNAFNCSLTLGAAGVIILKKFSIKEIYALGPELVTNGTFNSDVSGWTARSGAVQISSGAARGAFLTGTEAAFRQAISTVVGKQYLVTAKRGAQSLVGALTFATYAPTIGYTADINAQVATSQTFQGMFTAKNAVTEIEFWGTGDPNGYFEIDDVSVREIISMSQPLELVNYNNTLWQ